MKNMVENISKPPNIGSSIMHRSISQHRQQPRKGGKGMLWLVIDRQHSRIQTPSRKVLIKQPWKAGFQPGLPLDY